MDTPVKLREFLYNHVLTGSGYAKKHLAKSRDSTITLSERRFHKMIGTLEGVPVLGSAIGLAEGLYNGARNLVGRAKKSPPDKRTKDVELVRKRILPIDTTSSSDDESTDTVETSISEKSLSPTNSDKNSAEEVETIPEFPPSLKAPIEIHPKLINLILKLYPQADLGGICLGFAMMGMQAVFLGQVDKFNRRLEKIEQILEATSVEISTGNETKDLFGTVTRKLQQSKDFDLLAFLEGLHVCTMGSKYPMLTAYTTEPRGHFSLNFIKTHLSLVASKELEDKGKIIKINEIVRTSAYTEPELFAYFKNLKENFETPPLLQNPISIVLKTIRSPHAMTLGYDPKEKTWIFIDANSGLAEKVTNDELLAKKVIDGFKKSMKFDALAISSEIYAISSDPQEIESLKTKEKSAHSFLCENQDEEKISPFFNEYTDWLLLAAINNDLASVEILLKHGVSPNLSVNGELPLHIASYFGHTEIALSLIKAPHIDLNVKDLNAATALHKASACGRQEIIRALISNPKVKLAEPDKVGNTPLDIAILVNNPATVKLLLSKKERLGNYMRNSLLLASKRGNLAIVQLLLESGEASPEDRDIAKKEALGPNKDKIIELLK